MYTIYRRTLEYIKFKKISLLYCVKSVQKNLFHRSNYIGMQFFVTVAWN